MALFNPAKYYILSKTSLAAFQHYAANQPEHAFSHFHLTFQASVRHLHSWPGTGLQGGDMTFMMVRMTMILIKEIKVTMLKDINVIMFKLDELDSSLEHDDVYNRRSSS